MYACQVRSHLRPLRAWVGHTGAATPGTAAEVNARQPEIARLETEVDRLVYDLYGLTEDEIALVEARVGRGE